ncbi:unnamed protein product [Vitrella brassicaformis CCMP3155]|uniref:Signal recognition particle subunit SRP72 n=1 Tax=Vitrella brassicaformis (strain CCMP3155) TaxID=1169540 RepID=A0A0G4E8H6_VITBC|nr:unnamed protein product [Vitrella brassicaformis CCMP3155]|mmetsp:Transcript_16001/g.38188  ORF Transcript_16001/g.38188 Transcript_16001/m.38188 type:complete len:689 (-) Transcript_16001:313-2379(-)|eukprot:CEL91633.1 unnamed protein product [Vitrella brassicaformis CCMP3155]
MGDVADPGEIFNAIDHHFEREEFEEALAKCNQVLDLSSEDVDALRCKAFCLLQLSRWTAVLDLIDKARKSKKFDLKKTDLEFEKAYCLYRLNRFNEALQVIQKVTNAGDFDGGEDDPEQCFAKLEAQVRYRMGDYGKCRDIYEGLLEDEDNAQDKMLIVNLLAACISGNLGEQTAQAVDRAEGHMNDSYEVAFNMACTLIEKGDLTGAQDILKTAQELCRRELESDEDVQAEGEELDNHPELASIKVQSAFIQQRKGDLDGAAQIYNSVLRQHREDEDHEIDVTVLAVAQNNLVALKPEGKSLFDSLKRINVASKESLEHKLTTKQAAAIALNKCLVLLQAGKMEECRRALQAVQPKFSTHPRFAIINAYLQYVDKKTSKAEEILRTALEAAPREKTKELVLALVEFKMSQNHFSEAVQAMRQLPEESLWQPGFLSVAVSLYQRAKDIEGAAQMLEGAIQYWADKSAEEAESTLEKILHTSGELCVKLRRWEDATRHFKMILEKIDGTDRKAACGLVAAASYHDDDLAETYADRLPLPASVQRFDPEELEFAALPKTYRGKKAESTAAAAAAAADAEASASATDGTTSAAAAKRKAVKKRKRKIRYPKNFDPENPGPPPDPERWLPKHERSAFKKLYRRRKDQISRGPQGAMPTDANLAKPAGPSTARTEVAQEHTAQRHKGKKGRKK